MPLKKAGSVLGVLCFILCLISLLGCEHRLEEMGPVTHRSGEGKPSGNVFFRVITDVDFGNSPPATAYFIKDSSSSPKTKTYISREISTRTRDITKYDNLIFYFIIWSFVNGALPIFALAIMISVDERIFDIVTISVISTSFILFYYFSDQTGCLWSFWINLLINCFLVIALTGKVFEDMGMIDMDELKQFVVVMFIFFLFSIAVANKAGSIWYVDNAHSDPVNVKIADRSFYLGGKSHTRLRVSGRRAIVTIKYRGRDEEEFAIAIDRSPMESITRLLWPYKTYIYNIGGYNRYYFKIAKYSTFPY